MADEQWLSQIPTAAEIHEPRIVGKSTCLLLGHDAEILSLSTPPPSPTSPPPKSAAAKLLEDRSISILQFFNDRNVAAPYALYATPDFTFVHENEHSIESSCSAIEAVYFMEHVILRNPEHMVEIVSSAAEVDEVEGQAIAWIGIKIHDQPDGFMPGMEKVTCLFWKRVEELGGERRWMWWKHLCLSARLPMTR